MPQIRNPILPGFNADPSILRVGLDYYIAVSTFEWYPGVQIYHSTDLANWDLVTRPLSRKSQLDMRGNPDSCGIWAPCLTHDGHRYFLVYTDVKRKDGSFKDTHNYIVTAERIEGPWSDPFFVNSSGFDPSLFHDPDNGKKWFVNMLWDHRKRPRTFAGIRLQEWDERAGKLIGPRKTIYHGSELDLVEGPHLYKRGGYYYLLTAEGGTSYHHACTLARSTSIWGPYEEHPDVHVLTSKDHPNAAIQRAGHGDLVETPEGKWFLAHLMGRPVTQKTRCVLGRECGLQEAEWREDGWLYVKEGPVPSLYVDVPGMFDESVYWAERRYSFAGAVELHKDFQWLRTPETERIFVLKRGALELYGRESIGSWFEQALVARRQTHFSYYSETVLDFSPTDERQFAGLTGYYSRYNFFYLTVTANAEGEREVLLMSSENSYPEGMLNHKDTHVRIPREGKVRLAMRVEGGQKLQFYFGMEAEGELEAFGPVLDASILSDECGGHQADGSFTGAFTGMAASDCNGEALPARFDYFLYRPDVNNLRANHLMTLDTCKPPSRELLELIAAYGWDVNPRAGPHGTQWPLLWSLVQDIDLVRWCVDHGARVHVPDPPTVHANGTISYSHRPRPTILGEAASSGNVETSELLRSKSAPLDRRTLHRAVENERLDMIRHLVEVVGLDVNADGRDPFSMYHSCGTPICITAFRRGSNWRFQGLVLYLLDHGADPDLSFGEGNDSHWPSAVKCAEASGNTDFLQALEGWRARKEGAGASAQQSCVARRVH